MVNQLIKEGSFYFEKSNDPELSRRAINLDQKRKVYIAKSIKTDRFYTGISPNPNKRLELHNKGSGSKFARDQGPLELVYISEPFSNKSEARKREIQIKGWRIEKKQWLIDGLIR